MFSFFSIPIVRLLMRWESYPKSKIKFITVMGGTLSNIYFLVTCFEQ